MLYEITFMILGAVSGAGKRDSLTLPLLIMSANLSVVAQVQGILFAGFPGLKYLPLTWLLYSVTLFVRALLSYLIIHPRESFIGPLHLHRSN